MNPKPSAENILRKDILTLLSLGDLRQILQSPHKICSPKPLFLKALTRCWSSLCPFWLRVPESGVGPLPYPEWKKEWRSCLSQTAARRPSQSPETEYSSSDNPRCEIEPWRDDKGPQPNQKQWLPLQDPFQTSQQRLR